MEQPRIAVVIATQQIDEMLNLIALAKEQSEWLELRADYLPDITNAVIDKLAQVTRGVNVLFTLRSEEQGGKFQGSKQERFELFKYALGKNFAYYDIDLAAIADYLPFIVDYMHKIVLSYHNFTETPDGLLSILKKMQSFHPAICKFATQINKESDLQALQSLLVAEPNQLKIIIGMGELGKIGRIFYPLLGSFLTFAALDDSQSAPGQIQVRELKNIYQNIFKIVNNGR